MTPNRVSLSFVPPLLPNQTLYSWEAVFHEMSGNATVDETRLQLCGTVKGGRHFHIPSHLNALCASTQLTLGPPEFIVKTATTIPFYTQFRTQNVAASALKRIRGNSSYGIAQSLGMAKTGVYSHPPRRSCFQCIQADKAEYGFAYWRRDHQLPGVLICPKHGAALLSLPYDHDSIYSQTVLWPDDDWNLMNTSTLPDWPTDTRITLHRLALLAADMAKGELAGGYSERKMKNACLTVLRERNLTAPDGSLVLPQALHEYGRHFKCVACIPEIAAATQGSIRPILYLLRQRHSRTHPLEWMLIIDWLFGEWTSFQECYQQAIRTENVRVGSRFSA